jgi:putative SOS response-associated peptidase YedK
MVPPQLRRCKTSTERRSSHQALSTQSLSTSESTTEANRRARRSENGKRLDSINAMAETLTQKAAFKDASRKRRCLVVADGFYEWQKQQSGEKTPLLIQLKSERPFGFAGLYETWTPPVGETLSTCTIITSDYELAAPVRP